MSSQRKLWPKVEWDDEARAIELLDWETNPVDFERLYEHVLGLLRDRSGWTREKLASVIAEEQLHREVRAAAEKFEERFVSLPFYIYLRLSGLVLPELRSRKEQGGQS